MDVMPHKKQENRQRQVIGETESLCPECLRLVSAKRVAENGNVYLEKNCPEHGYYKTIIWRGDARSFLDWGSCSQEASGPLQSLTDTNRGCPYDCGPCPEHQANACTMVIEVTRRCNLSCPVCFASSGALAEHDPDLETIRRMYQTVLDTTGTPTIQLSGGEPTVRDDLPEIVAMGRQMGFEHIMINTNGIRIAKDKEYLRRLVDSGTGTIYFQFDGLTDEVYNYTRGSNLAKLKFDTIHHCADAKVGVILVPTLVPGINDQQLGDMVRFAKKWIPTVKGIHFQPVSYFGRYPEAPRDEDRITIPDVIDGLIKQVGEEIKLENFIPRRSKDSHCSFSSLFVLGKDGRLKAASRRLTEELISGWGGYKKQPWESARSFMNIHWKHGEEEKLKDAGAGCCCGTNNKSGCSTSESIFERVQMFDLSITCMPFQDMWTLDLERIKRCCGHVVTPHNRIVPFCVYYLTGASGERLYCHNSAKRC